VFLCILFVLAKDLDLDVEDVDDGVGMPSQDPAWMTLGLLNLQFCPAEGRAAHHVVLLPSIHQSFPKFIHLPLFENLLGFPWQLPVDLDLSTALLSEDDFGLGKGCHVRQAVVDET